MENSADEQKQRQHELDTASTWLADAREWGKFSTQLHSETEVLPNDDPARPNKLNVAQASVVSRLICVKANTSGRLKILIKL